MLELECAGTAIFLGPFCLWILHMCGGIKTIFSDAPGFTENVINPLLGPGVTGPPRGCRSLICLHVSVGPVMLLVFLGQWSHRRSVKVYETLSALDILLNCVSTGVLLLSEKWGTGLLECQILETSPTNKPILPRIQSRVGPCGRISFGATASNLCPPLLVLQVVLVVKNPPPRGAGLIPE